MLFRYPLFFMKKTLSFWLPVFLWCGLIFTMSSIPTLPKVGFIWWDFIMKKSAHLIEYAILYFLLWRAVTKASLKVKNRCLRVETQGVVLKDIKIWIIPLIFGLLYAMSDEFHQSFVMGRTSKVRDVGFDFLGMLLMLYWLKKKTKINLL